MSSDSQPRASDGLKRTYDKDFRADEAYRASLPDVQNDSAESIEGTNVPVLQVGIHDFKLPLRFHTEGGGARELETSVTGTVALAADHKGINMSRIVRVFYAYKDRVFSPELLEEILLQYKEELGSTRARLVLSFAYPIEQESLRSGLAGWQYYGVRFEGLLDDLDRMRKLVHFDFVYSSACPCSADLAEHARETRGQYSIAHSQRSKARLSVEVRPGHTVTVEDLQRHALAALRTETQVMVRREDEQAFAELNGAHVKFVEDAARLLHEQLDDDIRIKDFQVACAHLESLHSHDAVAVLTKGVRGGFDGRFDDFASLRC